MMKLFCCLLFNFQPDRVDSIVVEDIRPNGFPEEATLLVSLFLNIVKKAVESVPEGSAKDEAQKSIISFMNEKLEQVTAFSIFFFQ